MALIHIDALAQVSFDVAAEALGENYSGALVHDGWAPYDRFKNATHGRCLAHLLRRRGHCWKRPRGATRFPHTVKALLQEGLLMRDARDAGEIPLELAQAEAVRLQDDLYESNAASNAIRTTNASPDSCTDTGGGTLGRPVWA